MGSKAVRITFVRHGESTANRVQRWQGQGDSPLSELGRRQAEQLGARVRGRRFDRVVSSDLSRAQDTARATGFSFELEPAFREFDVGRWEGLTREEVAARYPEEIARLKAGEDVALGGGESYAAFSARIDAALARLRESMADGEHALVVCHGGVIGTVLSGALGLRGHNRWPFAKIANTSITELRFDPHGEVELSVCNDTLHLQTIGYYPTYEGEVSAVALVADEPPAASHGAFAAIYGAFAEGASAALARVLAAAKDAPVLAEHVHAAVVELARAHVASRVALSLEAALIHTFAHDALGARAGRLIPPKRGALCHVAIVEGRAVLLDYGVSA